MERIKAFCLAGIGLLVWSVAGCASWNAFQRAGDLQMAGLGAAVEVLRDEKGMAYIHAANDDDLLRAQGFVTAQDRLFQMELTRLFVSGRISELVGEAGRASDVRMRTLGFVRHAQRHAAILNDEARRFSQAYLDGVNAFVVRREDRPLEFRLAGLDPRPWTLTDSLAIAYFMGWESAANLKDEILAQALVEKLGPQRARELFPVNVNPDEENACHPRRLPWDRSHLERHRLDLTADAALLTLAAEQGASLRVGSNNWVAGPALSPGDRPVLANDPHLDARILPGPWYPCGLILPGSRAVGVSIPGIPGMVAGRTDRIALGMTNAYGDAQDLSIETIDPANPDRYLEGDTSHPFVRIRETLRIKDGNAPGGFRQEEIEIRQTRRGPVVSGRLKGLDTDKVITLRWSPFESMGPSLGMEGLLKARNVQEVRETLGGVTTIMLNFVFADVEGGYGWQTTGRLPIRARGEGLVPLRVTDGKDDWTGWIPFEKMPFALNPSRGWVGTCNHYTATCETPYYLSSTASPSYRYRRLAELLDEPGKKTVADHWRFQRDTVNLLGKSIAPLMAGALLASPDTAALGRILQRWDFRDDPHQAAPAVFQSVYGHFFRAAYEDELGKPLAGLLHASPYFWQEFLQEKVLAGDSPLFDDRTTPGVRETRDDLFRRAGREAIRELAPRYGSDPEGWTWGRLHTISFVSPLFRTGLTGRIFGASYPMGGSQETLYRASYHFNDPYDVIASASLRMVADLGDPDKVLAVLPGGVSGRLFDPHAKDQMDAFMNGDVRYWWFSDDMIHRHARTTQRLLPCLRE